MGTLENAPYVDTSNMGPGWGLVPVEDLVSS